MRLHKKWIIIGVTVGLLTFPLGAFAEETNSSQNDSQTQSQIGEGNTQTGDQANKDSNSQNEDKSHSQGENQVEDKTGDSNTQTGDQVGDDSHVQMGDKPNGQSGTQGDTNIEDKSGDSQANDGANDQSD